MVWRTALYGSMCYLAHWGLALTASVLLQPPEGGAEITNLQLTAARIAIEKIAGLVLLSITAFLAATPPQETREVRIVTGVLAAVVYQSIALLIYLMRFGWSAYRENNNLVATIVWSIGLAWFFGWLAAGKSRVRNREVA